MTEEMQSDRLEKKKKVIIWTIILFLVLGSIGYGALWGTLRSNSLSSIQSSILYMLIYTGFYHPYIIFLGLIPVFVISLTSTWILFKKFAQLSSYKIQIQLIASLSFATILAILFWVFYWLFSRDVIIMVADKLAS